MRTVLTILTSVAILCGAAMAVQAQDNAGEGTPPKKPVRKQLSKEDRLALTKLQIKMHRTITDLLEAQIEEKPDTEKIAGLQKELKSVRTEMQKLMPMPPNGRGPGQGSRRRGGPGPDGFGPGMMGPPGGGMGLGPGGMGMGPGGMGPGGPGMPDEEQDN